jgi:hypothetical protein
MTTTPAAIVAMAVLSLAGLLPVAALVGRRVIAVPLLPLGGAVIAALAATGFTALGGSFLAWFVAVASVSALAAVAYWVRWPDRRPWHRPTPVVVAGEVWCRLLVAVGALAVLGACTWSLRGLATPTVGFDARAVWLMRAGWFLQSQHQVLINLRVSDVVLIQTPYPPLVSAATAVAWRVTGDQSMRLGVVVIALLNTCALATGSFALVESGGHFTRRLLPGHRTGESSLSGSGSPSGGRWLSFAPLVVGIVVASLLVFVAFGITEPFMTNGYADPIWSLAALGAVAYGLQMGASRTNRGAALILVLVAGLSKNEGVATAGALVVLIALRGVVSMPAAERHRRWWRPVVIGAAELAALAAWPLLMRAIHARGESSTLSAAHEWPDRARAAYDGMAPYLHVIVLAAPLAVVGGLVLSRVRRRSGLANDWWAWAGLAGGLVVVGGAYVTSTAAIAVWLVGTVDRVTEFPALTGWWIVAMWAVVASGALGATRYSEQRHIVDPRSDPRSEADTIGDSSSRRAPTPVAVAAE